MAATVSTADKVPRCFLKCESIMCKCPCANGQKGVEFPAVWYSISRIDSAQELIPRIPVHLGFIQGRCDDKSAALLPALTHARIEELISFRQEIAWSINQLFDYPGGSASHRKLAKAFLCDAGAVAFQINRLKAPTRQSG
jgi:hypothetical protein